MNERLVTAAELGQLLSLSSATILDRWEAGDLPGFRLFGRKGGPVRFRLSEIEAALAGWRVNGPSAEEEVAPVPFQSPDPERSLALAPVPIRGGEDVS
jgi:predicted DNA-binding transcriptional regulator AlpA